MLHTIPATFSRYRKASLIAYGHNFAPFAGGEGQSRKRSRDEVAGISADAEVVDLIYDDEEEQQRRRIMQFARGKVSSQRTNSNETRPDNTAPAIISPASNSQRQSPPADEATARERIMAQAAAVNAEKGVSANNLLAQLHAERLARRGPPPEGRNSQEKQQAPGPDTTKIAGNVSPAAAGTRFLSNTTSTPAAQPSSSAYGNNTTFSMLSYNLWFREDVAIMERMQAISDVVSNISGGLPDVICFQEVTPFIYNVLSSAPWWRQYTVRPSAIEATRASYFTALLWKTSLVSSNAGTGGGMNTDGANGRSSSSSGKYASLPFENSRMGRDLKAVSLKKEGIRLRVATSHFESPTGWNKLNSEPRVLQCREALNLLDGMEGDSVLIGDLNWTEKNDGGPPLPPQW